jgi:hypothetical protein
MSVPANGVKRDRIKRRGIVLRIQMMLLTRNWKSPICAVYIKQSGNGTALLTRGVPLPDGRAKPLILLED